MSQPNYVPLAEAARRCGVSTDTMRRWIRAGRMPAKRLPDDQGRLFVLASALGAGGDQQADRGPRRQGPRMSRERRDARKRLIARGLLPEG